MRRLSISTLLLCFLLPSVVSAKADLNNFVVIGDSIAAGYQSGTISPALQQTSFPALIAQQAGLSFILPSLVSPPPPIPNNLAVPGERVCDTLSYNSVLSNPVAVLHNVMLGSGNTQISLAESSSPTTLLIEIGANDVILHAVVKQNIVEGRIAEITQLPVDQVQAGLAQGDPGLLYLAQLISNFISDDPNLKDIFLTSTADFQSCYAQLMQRTSLLPNNSATIVLNIPDVMGSAYVKLLISQGILNSYDVSVMQSRVTEFNNIIASTAKLSNAELLDVFKITQDIEKSGFVVGGQRLNNDFYCGVTSLDGIHPTNTTSALLANKVIQLLNSKFAAGIPMLSLAQVAAVDPLINLDLCASSTLPGSGKNKDVQNAINSMIKPAK